MQRWIVPAAALVLALGVGAQAAAQDNNTQLDEAARLTFESAREAFVAGDYEGALARFRQAYQLSQRPGLLYNIAQTLDRLRRDEETLQALRDYLEAAPGAPNRAEVEARIRVLETAVANRPQDPPPQDPSQSSGAGPTTPEPAPQRDPLAIVHPAVFISLAGLALVGGGLTIWAGLETLSLNDQYLATNDPAAAQTLYADADSMQLMTNIFIGVTATFGVAAVALAVISDWGAFGGGEEHAGLRLTPTFAVGPDSAVLGLGGSF